MPDKASKKLSAASAEATNDALTVLVHLAGTIEAPVDWAAEHDHYLYGTAKRHSQMLEEFEAPPQIRYDEPSDTLYVSFAPGEAAAGLELNPHILLRVDKKNRQPIGITLLDFSILAQQTEFGSKSFPLTGLAGLSPKTRELAIDLLRSAPVNEYLVLSAYSPTASETIPITLLRTDKIVQQVA